MKLLTIQAVVITAVTGQLHHGAHRVHHAAPRAHHVPYVAGIRHAPHVAHAPARTVVAAPAPVVVEEVDVEVEEVEVPSAADQHASVMEAQHNLHQARLSSDFMYSYNRPQFYWVVDSLPAASQPAGFSSSPVTEYLAYGDIADAYQYDVDAVEDQIRYYHHTGEHDPNTLLGLEISLDGARHAVQGFDHFQNEQLVTLVGGANSAQLGSTLNKMGDLDLLRWREANVDNAYLSKDLARHEYYHNGGDYSDYREAKRGVYVAENEEKGVKWRMYDWALPGSNIGSMWYYPFTKATKSDLRAASRARHHAEEDYYNSPSADSYHNLHMAEMNEDSERYEHMARMGGLLGSGLMEMFGWWKQGKIDEEVAEIEEYEAEKAYYESIQGYRPHQVGHHYSHGSPITYLHG